MFTAAQNKAATGEFVDSIGELVAICEKEGFIPRYYIEQPNDKVDETIRDMQRYTYNLVTEEMNLGMLIESAIKQNELEDSIAREQEKGGEDTELSAVEEVERELGYNDYEEYSDFIENEEMSDKHLQEFLEQNGNDL